MKSSAALSLCLLVVGADAFVSHAPLHARGSLCRQSEARCLLPSSTATAVRRGRANVVTRMGETEWSKVGLGFWCVLAREAVKRGRRVKGSLVFFCTYHIVCIWYFAHDHDTNSPSREVDGLQMCNVYAWCMPVYACVCITSRNGYLYCVYIAWYNSTSTCAISRVQAK